MNMDLCMSEFKKYVKTKIMDIINIWNKNTINLITESTEVTAVFCEMDIMGNKKELMFHYGFFSENDAKEGCFWFTDSGLTPRIVKMKIDEFIEKHVANCKPMNPFYGAGRLEFLSEWEKLKTKDINL